MSRLWGGRFDGDGLHPDFEVLNRSLGFDHRLLPAELAASAAWARALGRLEILSSDEVASLETALTEIGREHPDTTSLTSHDDEDLHSFVEARLVEKLGALGKRLHAGRSRNDQVATDLRLYCRERVVEIDARFAELLGSLAEQAEETAAWSVPGLTHLQGAQPITLGHHALSFVEMLARDRERFQDAARRMERCPLGSAALAGSGFPVDRERIAEELGFAGPTRNSLDAVSDRDFACELAFAASLTMVHLSRLAEDWIFWSSSEVGFLRFDDAVATGSSLLPQKRNPDAAELVRGKTGRVLGDLQSLLVVLKGLPSSYDKDLQEDKEALFDALDTVSSCLRVMAIAVRSCRFDRERCAAAATRGFLNATDLADLLVRAGVPFRTAHDRVGEAVRVAQAKGVELDELPQDEQERLLPELSDDLTSQLSVDAVLARRDLIGGTAPSRVAAEARRWSELLGSEASAD
ncbi:MAG: argininosuccinate lyase [Acidobacteriota bacterium]